MSYGKYEGFAFNITVYTLSMVIASMFPFVARTIASFFIETPGIAKLKLDASYLFDVVYPIMGVLTIAAFLAGGYLACYFTGYKIAYKTRETQPKAKVKTHIIISGILAFAWNVYLGYSAFFSGMYGMQFWYPSAITASLFGLVDKRNLLGSLSSGDIVVTNFVITGLIFVIGFIVFVYAIIISTAFVYIAYRGRNTGERHGLEAIAKYVDEIKKSDSTKR